MNWPFKRKAQSNIAPRTTTVMSRPAYYQPYSNAQSYLSTPQDLNVFSLLRQAIPVLESAIDQLVRLTGNAEVKWESDAVQAEWDAWCDSVRIAPLGRGLNDWLNGMQKRALTFGTAASELVVARGGQDVYGFMHISPATLKLRQDPENILDVIVAQQQPGAYQPVELDREFITLIANDPEDSSPYGRSLFYNIPFIAELILEMAHALKQDWNRTGAPAFAITVEIPDGLADATEVATAVNSLIGTIQTHWTAAMSDRKTQGTIKDFVGAGKINIQTVGADGKRLEFEIPWRSAMEQIVSVTHLPPWMLGFHWSTTERLSTEQAAALKDVVNDYQTQYTVPLLWAADWWARIRGYGNIGREAVWPELSIDDRVEMARAALFDAQAQATREKTATRLWQTGVIDQQGYAEMVVEGDEEVTIATAMSEPPSIAPVAGTSANDDPNSDSNADSSGDTQRMLHPHKCGCSDDLHKAADNTPVSFGEGEVPSDQRIVDAIDGFKRDISGAVRELRSDIWRVLRLPDVRNAAVEDLFAWREEQRVAFNEAVDIFLERMAGKDRSKLGFASAESQDGIIQEWERYAHAIGTTRTSEMSAVEAALITPDRNSQAIQNLMSSAFDRLSEDSALRIEGYRGELLNVIEQGINLGSSPIEVAREISSKLDGYEGWRAERLARTETAFAQVAGQYDEMKAEGIDTAGVDGSNPPWHPNCMCDLTIEKIEGRWVAKYNISAQACSLCQAYAGR